MASHEEERVSSGDEIRLPPVQTNVSLTASLDQVNDRSSPLPTTTTHKGDRQQAPLTRESVKLPALTGSERLVSARYSHEATAIQESMSHESVLKTKGGKEKTKKLVRNSSSSDRLVTSQSSQQETTEKAATTTASPVKLLQSQLKVTRHSTFKGTPLGYKPASVKRRRDENKEMVTNTQGTKDQDNHSGVATTRQPISKPLIEGLDPDTPQENRSNSTERHTPTGEPHTHSRGSGSPSLDTHLYQQAQRYDKLNQVLALLQQAQESKTEEREGGSGGESEPGTPLKISELKSHIKSALDEAVRLRADTEALQHRIINKVSLCFVCDRNRAL